MCSASSPHSKVMVETIPTTSHRIQFQSQVDCFQVGPTVTFLSHVMEIDWLNDEIQLVYLGPMVGIDRV